MKQLIQNLKNGDVYVEDIPTPHCGENKVLIKTRKTLISLGTEKMLLNFGKGSYLSKAKQQPDKVKMVLNKIKTDGLKPTLDAVLNKLDTPLPLGYSNIGEVVQVGKSVKNLNIGDRVVSNGNHAEIVCINHNLCAKVPDNVTDEEAAFTIVSSIALQGIRIINPTLGETTVVIGLGLIGLLSCQILRANGCNVIGFDLDPEKVKLAKKWGVHAHVSSDSITNERIVNEYTNEVGADSVLITASTPSNDPIDLAPKICRQKGRVVLVGVIGLEVNRTDFFMKEISFTVSCSYGPGRYNDAYEKEGLDYPIGYVRWTEKRNFEAILDLMSQKKILLSDLITHNITLNESPNFYSNLDNLKSLTLGILISYESDSVHLSRKVIQHTQPQDNSKAIAFIGAGAFTSGTLLPQFKKTKARLKYICSASGLSSAHLAKKFSIENNTTDINEVISDPEVQTVVITTPHNTHASMTKMALEAGKSVFVEKPLCLSHGELLEIEDVIKKTGNTNLTIGFNRRFSPLIKEMNQMLIKELPMAIDITINAGHIDSKHWTQDLKVGGGRLLGEGCHFIDLARHLAGSAIKDSSIVFMNNETRDTFSINLKFENGSIATIKYFSNGNKSVSKEMIKVFAQGNIFELDNFKSLNVFYANGKKKTRKLSSQDKGHEFEVAHFVKSTENIVPLDEIFEVMGTTLKLNESI